MYEVFQEAYPETVFRNESMGDAIQMAGEELADWYALGQGAQFFTLEVRDSEDPDFQDQVEIQVSAEIKVDWL